MGTPNLRRTVEAGTLLSESVNLLLNRPLAMLKNPHIEKTTNLTYSKIEEFPPVAIRSSMRRATWQ
jgi:hypothetical protein